MVSVCNSGSSGLGRSRTSSSAAEEDSEGNKSVNITELAFPEGLLHKVDIVLFHGLHQALASVSAMLELITKVNEAVSRLHNLVESLANFNKDARILSVNWNSQLVLSREGGRKRRSWALMGQMVADDLLACGIGDRPSFFIGHSLGGLLMKQVIITMHSYSRSHSNDDIRERSSAFLKDLAGLVFIATPHTGAQVSARLTLLERMGMTRHPPLSSRLAKMNDVARDLNQKFQSVLSEMGAERRFACYSLYEQRPYVEHVGCLNFKNLVVPEASATSGMDYCWPVDADHLTICDPTELSQQISKIRALDVHLPSIHGSPKMRAFAPTNFFKV